MLCYTVESRADWVAKFNKTVMSRGQQDRDDGPMLNKSFVYHRLIAWTTLARWSLRFERVPPPPQPQQQQLDASALTQGAAGTGAGAGTGSGAGASAGSPSSATQGMVALNMTPLQQLQRRLARLTSSTVHGDGTAAPSSASPTHATGSAPPSHLLSQHQSHHNAALKSLHRGFSSRDANANVNAHANGHFSGGGASGGGAGGVASNLGALDRSAGPAGLGTVAFIREEFSTTAAAGTTGGDGAKVRSTAKHPSRSRSQPPPPLAQLKPFSPQSIEHFFQLKYAKQFLREVRWANLLFLAFGIGMLVYVAVHHPDTDTASSSSSSSSAGGIVMAALFVGLFSAFDIASSVQSLIRHGMCDRCTRRGTRTGAGANPDAGSSESWRRRNRRRTGAAASVADESDLNPSAPSTESPVPFTPDALLIDHFARHLQAYSLAFLLLLQVWVLVALGLWGLGGDDVEIHPVFAMMALLLYASCSLRLQFRMLAPLLSAGLLAFIIVLAAQGHGAAHLLLVLLHLLVALAIGLDFLYHFERAARSNFLLAYALEKEQAFMDQFLHNLLPKDVVALLKKQNPSLARQVVGVGAGVGVGGGPGATGVSMVGSPPNRRSLSSPFFAGGGGGLGEGGMASRFAMHFPATTVFESDIVGYTQMASALSPIQTLNLLNHIFSRFDEVANAVGVEKIETIGDAFMCMTFDGPPNPVLDFALTIVPVLQACNAEHFPQQKLEIRMGICTGSCFGGIVGTEIPRFHLFGEAHDVAIHIEQNGRPGDIIVSSSSYKLSSGSYDYQHLEELVVDGYQTYLLLGRKGDTPPADNNQAQREQHDGHQEHAGKQGRQTLAVQARGEKIGMAPEEGGVTGGVVSGASAGGSSGGSGPPVTPLRQQQQQQQQRQAAHSTHHIAAPSIDTTLSVCAADQPSSPSHYRALPSDGTRNRSDDESGALGAMRDRIRVRGRERERERDPDGRSSPGESHAPEPTKPLLLPVPHRSSDASFTIAEGHASGDPLGPQAQDNVAALGLALPQRDHRPAVELSVLVDGGGGSSGRNSGHSTISIAALATASTRNESKSSLEHTHRTNLSDGGHILSKNHSAGSYPTLLGVGLGTPGGLNGPTGAEPQQQPPTQPSFLGLATAAPSHLVISSNQFIDPATTPQ